MVVVDEADQHTMEAADKSRIGGTKMVPIAVLDPPKAGGVNAASEAG